MTNPQSPSTPDNQQAVAKKHTVSISNFGEFVPSTSPARMYNHPQLKKKIWKEEITRVKFRPFGNFKECVSGKRVKVGSGVRETTEEG
jgi:nucleoid DNA-binding protein